MKKVIQWKICVIALMVGCLLLSIFFTLIKLTNKESKDVSAYTITSSDFLNQYDNYSTFEINSLTGLKLFGNSCYVYNKSGKDWSGKTIKLTADIDCGGESIIIGPKSVGNGSAGVSVTPTFKGTFDGCGYTISNFTAASQVGIKSVSPGGGITVSLSAIGLFAKLESSAEVKNLKLKNFKSKEFNPGSNASNFCIGGIAGYAVSGSKITNCMVENFTNNQYTSASVRVAGVFGFGDPTVNNCYVSGLQGENPVTNISGVVISAGIGPAITSFYNPVAIECKSAVIKNCIVVKNNSSATYSNDITMVSNVTNCYSSAKQTSGLNVSSEGGADGSIWYYSEDYFDYPLLRIFIKWKTVTFLASSGGSVDIGAISIPKDANKKFSSSAEVISVYNRVIKAVPSDGYAFSSWTCNNEVSYTANFVELVYDVTFSQVTVNGSTITPSKNKVTCKANDTIGTEIDSSNNTYKYIISHKGGTKTEITYNLSGLKTYTIKSWGNTNAISANRTITPEFELKKYNVSLN